MEFNRRLTQAALVERAGEGTAVADHVWVSVGLLDISEVNVAEFFVRGALYECLSLNSLYTHLFLNPSGLYRALHTNSNHT